MTFTTDRSGAKKMSKLSYLLKKFVLTHANL